jgi:hypothetical protein
MLPKFWLLKRVAVQVYSCLLISVNFLFLLGNPSLFYHPAIVVTRVGGLDETTAVLGLGQGATLRVEGCRVFIEFNH